MINDKTPLRVAPICFGAVVAADRAAPAGATSVATLLPRGNR
jgi:hypothetical protein